MRRQRPRLALAGGLKAVLDKRLWFDLDEFSAESGGDRGDCMSAGVEKVGEILVAEGRTQAVYLVRRSDDAGRDWASSPSTVRGIDDWYARLEDRWIREWLPEALLQPGPVGILLRWRWFALPGLQLRGLGLRPPHQLGDRRSRGGTDYSLSKMVTVGPEMCWSDK